MQLVLLFSTIEKITGFLEPNVIDYINTKQTFAFESFEKSNIFAFEWHNINVIATRPQKVLVYMDQEDLFIFCENEECLKSIAVLLPEGLSNEKALYQFFVNLFHDDIRFLENFETRITDIEDSALKNSKQDYLSKIIYYRKQLLSLKRYYEQLDLILDNLCANDNKILSAEGERYMSIISGRVHRYHSYVLNLRDYVTQMREAYQAQIDIEQNQIMRVFTVITSVFLPLTLIVGWYGMNFKYMPELYWRFGYLYVIILSIVVCIALLWYFKKKKWF
ncbi:MAG TPA: CorA family divalent cation transporter [Erysipelotrichaceae bacterium]|jgi:magnesium transporter|nr:CorA family divalent cation transporter [Erysipelotrichaceae bacterium]HQB31961.1 CorA family divalent cation transporter [Erysipelotrichaceae bacterium]